jgi:hypothetical protein
MVMGKGVIEGVPPSSAADASAKKNMITTNPQSNVVVPMPITTPTLMARLCLAPLLDPLFSG